MHRLIILVVSLLALIAATAAIWIGPAKIGTWNTVVKNDVVAAIETRLGEIRVRQTEVHQRVSGLAQGIDRLREGQITTEVRAEQIAKRVERTAALQVRAESGLGRLRDLIAANVAATLGGKTYSPQELNPLGERVAAAVEAVRGQRAALEQAQRMLTESAVKLRARVEEGRLALSQLQNQLTLVDGKIDSLTVLRDAATIAGATDGSLANQFQTVQADLDSLYGKVEAGLRIEEDRWKTDLTGAPNIEPLLKELGGSEATLQRIDELLGRAGPAERATQSGTNGGKP